LNISSALVTYIYGDQNCDNEISIEYTPLKLIYHISDGIGHFFPVNFIKLFSP